MKYHDYFLVGYEVRDGGEKIVLHLKSESDPNSGERSDIEFSSVALYHIIHTNGAIVARIERVPVREVLVENRVFIEFAHRQVGVRYLSDDFDDYVFELEAGGHFGWFLESAIGLSGFVVAKSAEQVDI